MGPSRCRGRRGKKKWAVRGGKKRKRGQRGWGQSGAPYLVVLHGGGERAVHWDALVV
jgi:hypothetical protein